MKFLSLIVAIILSIPASAQFSHKLSDSKGNHVLTYTLPTTVLDITIEAEKTVKKPGTFYNYAKKYLDIDNPITKAEESWAIKSVVINTRGTGDVSERYTMEFKSGNVPSLILNNENFPIAINADAQPEDDRIEIPVAVAAKPTPLESIAASQVINEEMLQSQSTAKRAELAAAQIYALRQSRTDLITGQTEQMPPDGKAMQLILDNITAQEAALMAMFIGTEQRSTVVNTIQYIPEREVSNKPIARISAIEGLVDVDDLSGEPIYLTIDIISRGKLPGNEKGIAKEFPKGGVAYRVPGKANIKVSFKGKNLAERDVEVAQYGVVFGLDPNMFIDKKAPSFVIFNSATGAIKEFGTVKP